LAYGRVAQILKSAERVLAPLGPGPARFLSRGLPKGLFRGFKHRFTTGEQVEGLLTRTAEALKNHGSLELLMKECLKKGGSFLAALNLFSRTLSPPGGGFPLVPAPEDGSACKRLLLYVKWMVRRDEVDPGGWTVFSPRDLVVPTDTHMRAIALRLGLTRRKQADLRSALEITQSFARAAPEDPARYDFALTRFGIRGGLKISDLSKLEAGRLEPHT
jgi:uncharacterized protein (TIGR02757 family)